MKLHAQDDDNEYLHSNIMKMIKLLMWKWRGGKKKQKIKLIFTQKKPLISSCEARHQILQNKSSDVADGELCKLWRCRGFFWKTCLTLTASISIWKCSWWNMTRSMSRMLRSEIACRPLKIFYLQRGRAERYMCGDWQLNSVWSPLPPESGWPTSAL